MTVSSSTNSVILSANGTAHSFAFTFKIFAAADLQVIVRSTAGVETVKTLNSHYIIADSSVGNANGGNVLFKYNTGTSSDAHYSTTDYRPANNEKVILRRAQPKTQGLDLVANDPFPAESFEESLDKLTFMVQDVQEAVDRSFKFSRSNTLDSSGSSIASSYSEIEENTTSRANKLLSFDSTGVPIATQEIGTLKGNWAASTVYQERDIVKDTSTSEHYIVNAAHTSSGAQPLTTNANAAKYTAITSFSGATLSPGQLVVDNITIDGNTISTTNSDGNLVLTPEGDGQVHVDGEIYVEGNDISQATNYIRIGRTATGGDDISMYGVNPWLTISDVSTTDSTPYYGGGTINFEAKDAGGTTVSTSRILGGVTDRTASSVDGGLRIETAVNSSMETAVTVAGTTVTLAGKLAMPDVTSGKILVADGTSYEEVAVSGDVTMASSGAVTIASGAVENAMLAGSIADSKLSTITTADKVSGAAIQIDGATDGTSITVADADKILIDDGGTTKYINASQLNTYISAEATSLAADNLAAGDAAINLTTTSGNITIDAQANNSDIILKGTDGSADTTFLTISGADAGAATFNSTVTATGFIIGSADINENDLEAIDGITAGTGAASKAVVLDSSSNVNNIGTISATNLNISNNVDVDGTLEADAITINGTAIGSIYSPLASPTFTGTVTTADASLDGAVTINEAGADKDFRVESASNSSMLKVDAGGNFVGIGTGSYSATLSVSGSIAATTDLSIGDDLSLTSDAAVLNFGADSDVSLTHVHDTGLLLNSTRQLQFGDSGTYIYQSADGVLDLVSDTEIEINATTIDVNGNADISGTLGVTGVVTANAGVVVDNITIDGTEISISSGDLTIAANHASGDLIFEANGATWYFTDGDATQFSFQHNSGNITFNTAISNDDFIITGVDDGSAITALTLDMSNSGFAFFNANAHFNESGVDTDFRIKSVNQTNMFYVDASTDRIGIGTATPDRIFTIRNGGPVVEIDPAGQSSHPIYFNYNRSTSAYLTPEYWALGHKFMYNGGDLALEISSSGNLGLGISPESHYGDYQTFDFGKTGLLISASSGTNVTMLINNAYLNSSTAWVYKEADEASMYEQSDGTHRFYYASAGGSADASLSWSEALRINNSGNVGIGTSSPASLLHLETTRAGSISGGSDHKGSVITLKTEGKWESGYGNDASASDNDFLGGIEFSTGDDSTGEGVRAAIRATVDSYYNTNSLVFETAADATAAAPVERMRINPSGNVGIGTSTMGANSRLTIAGADNSNYLAIRNTSASDASTYRWGYIRFEGTQSGNEVSTLARIGAFHEGTADDQKGIFTIATNGGAAGDNPTERMRIDSVGHVFFVKSSSALASVGIELLNDGRIVGTTSGDRVLLINRLASDGDLVDFYQAGSKEGTISVSGSTVSYNGFSGLHETSGIASNVAIGTICSTIDELDVYPDTQKDVEGETEEHPKKGETRADHAKIKVSDTEGDKRVYGVLQRYDDNGKPLVASVGIGSVKVTGACEGGDLLESNGDGTAKVQSDDIIRSKTIGKVTIGNSGTGVKLVSCVLYCG